MREILFRGKTTKDKEWVYGDLLHDGYDYDVAIWEKEDKLVTEVSAETVGQFTGMTDKNGKKIFEGDIVRYVNPDGCAISGTVSYGEHSYSGTHDIGFYVEWQRPGWAMHLRDDLGFWINFREIEVIGNIHDHPELLNGGS